MKRRKFIQNSLIAGTALGAAPFACKQKKDAEIVILGGGYSGLYLAFLLEKAGREFILLEGSDRLGGRMFTHPKLGRDVGGRGIGDRYDETMALVKELNVELIDITPYMNSPTSIYYKGKLYSDWKDRATNPRMLEFILPNKTEELTSLTGWYQRPDLDIKYSELLANAGRTEEEIDLINISSNYNDVRETSSMNSYHSKAFRKFNGSKSIYNFKGGTKAFIDALVGKINGKLITNKKVTSIKSDDTNAIVTCEDGSSFSCSKVVSTLPFSTLRDVDLSISANPNQKKAIEKLPYTLITQIHLNATSAYWEEDETPASMWTDTPIERVMDFNPSPDHKDLVCWVNGKGTAYFDKMSDKEIGDATLKILAEIRPSSEGKVEYLGTHNWGKYEFNKGAYVEFGPGQAVWFEDMIKPAGNVHFAGEHTAKASRGIEGAAESAKRVFEELVA